MPHVLREQMGTSRCPVAVSCPGLSPRSAPKELAKAISRAVPQRSSDAAVEESATEFLVTHRALSRTGVAVVGPGIPEEAFVALAELERAWSARAPRPSAIDALLTRVGNILRGLFSEREIEVLLHASSLTAFSDFPIGLMLPPGGGSPLCCRVPVASRPLYPLTRALQFELLPAPTVFLRGKLRVLILECIPKSDHVGRLSRVGWRVAEDTLKSTPGVECTLVEATSVPEVRQTLSRVESDILVLSAHGTSPSVPMIVRH